MSPICPVLARLSGHGGFLCERGVCQREVGMPCLSGLFQDEEKLHACGGLPPVVRCLQGQHCRGVFLEGKEEVFSNSVLTQRRNKPFT